MRSISLVWLFFWATCTVAAAEAPPHLQRQKTIFGGQVVHQLDTLSIVSGSFVLMDQQKQKLPAAFFELDPITAVLRLRIPEEMRQGSLIVSYQVWPINFSLPIVALDTSLIRLPGPGEDAPLWTTRPSVPEQGLLRYEGLQSSGSISRGLTLGNRQDPTLNSAMNLQLSGNLTDEIEILAVVSDQNIPFQPDGSTQQLQDFDRVFIRLDGYGGSMTAGDFELERPAGHFMNVNRRARGGMLTYQFQDADEDTLSGFSVSATAAGAISRGKYARNSIQGQEGNQGPYRLRGTDNESFIIVLAGTERVFIDGRLLQRGRDRDYIIDYNTAELTFSPTVLITRDSRITVEFEYAERNYTRSMYFTGAEAMLNRTLLHVNFFSEQDHPGQPLFQEISAARQARMAAVGNNIEEAFDWNIDSTGFQNDRVMYRLTDSLGFDTVFVFSIDPEEALFQVGFSFVGEGNGNYRQVNASANGRVFQWIAPVNGIPQGTHEPIIRLVTPKRHRMLSVGGTSPLGENQVLRYEYALSERDINLFSDLDKEENLGHALQIELTDVRPAPVNDPGAWEWNSSLSWEFTDARFQAVERYRNVEFERDWNLLASPSRLQEHLPSLSVMASNRNLGRVHFYSRSLIREQEYRGFLNGINSQLQQGRNTLQYNGSLLVSSGLRNTSFYRHTALYRRDLGLISAGVSHQMEENRLTPDGQTDLLAESLRFRQWEWFAEQSERARDQYRIFYRRRDDGLPAGASFQRDAIAHDYGLQYRFQGNPNQRPSVQVIYRELEVAAANDQEEQRSRTFNSRLDYSSRWASGAITSVLFYETASGRERKREYMYVEVPAGQGIYVWNDYNGNGVMELDEFEISPFPDEANFIRVFVPTDEFVPVYSTAISQSINMEPAVIWRQEEGIRGVLARFSNRLNYRIDNRREGAMDASNLNPFVVDVNDTSLISLNSLVRNSLFFNRTHPGYSLEWTFQDLRTKSLLSNGYESRVRVAHTLRLRWNMTRQFSLNTSLEAFENSNESEFFLQRNFQLRAIRFDPALNYQVHARQRFSLSYGYEQQQNRNGDEASRIHKAAAESRTGFPGRGSLNLRLQLSQIQYPHDINTPMAFEILQALRPGTNVLWNINWQHNLNAFMQLSLQYNGRKPPDTPAIHTGSVQIRAMF